MADNGAYDIRDLIDFQQNPDGSLTPTPQSNRVCWLQGHDFTALHPGLPVRTTCRRCGTSNPWLGWRY